MPARKESRPATASLARCSISRRFFCPVGEGQCDANAATPTTLKNLSLEELSQIEVTTPSKDTQSTLVSAGGGNEEQGFANLRYGGGNGNDFNYRVYCMGFTRGPEYHSDGRNFD